MCSENETVLSDVHISHCRTDIPAPVAVGVFESDTQLKKYFEVSPDLKVVKSRFEFRRLEKPYTSSENRRFYTAHATSVLTQESGSSRIQENECAVYDEDGDLVYPHAYVTSKEVIFIDHFLGTPLSLVGLQVWQGSLLLADYFLHNGRSILRNARVIDLGAGTGFCSIVAAMFAEAVISTDYDEGVLELCQRNVLQNKDLINACTEVRKLDWCKDVEEQTSNDLRWNLKYTEEEFSKLNIAIAADVIYRDDLTDGLFKTVDRLMAGSSLKFYLALEKRLNFTLEDLDVACPAYCYFLACIKKYGFTAQQVKRGFPQCFNYSRTPQLELWILQKKI